MINIWGYSILKSLVRVSPPFDDLSYFVFDIFEDLGYIQLDSACQYSFKLIFLEHILHSQAGDHLSQNYLSVARSLVNVFRVKNIRLDIISADKANFTDGYEEAVSAVTPGMFVSCCSSALVRYVTVCAYPEMIICPGVDDLFSFQLL